MLNIICHLGNANQTTMRYYFTPSRIAIIKKKITSVGEEKLSTKQKGSLLMGEDICKYMSDKGFISKTYKELIQLNIDKQTTQLKTGQRTQKGIFPRKTNRCPIDT